MIYCPLQSHQKERPLQMGVYTRRSVSKHQMTRQESPHLQIN